MILGKSVHTVHYWLLFIKFMGLGSEWFEAECALRFIISGHFELSDKNPPKACLEAYIKNYQ